MFQINFSQIAEFCSFDFVWRGFLFLWVLGMGYIILLWHSLSLHIIILLLYVHCIQLRLCQEGQLLSHTVLGQASWSKFTSIGSQFFQ